MSAAPKSKSQTRFLHKTRNGLSDNAKQVSVQLLNERLADGIDLALAVKQAHWNLKGPQFIGIHEMLDGFRTELDELNDKMAERTAAIGGVALGTSQVVSGASKLPSYPTDIFAIADHLAALIDRYALYGNGLREGIDQTDDAGDADTSDLFTEVSRAVDQQLWFLEAHVQQPTGPIRDGDGASSRG